MLTDERLWRDCLHWRLVFKRVRNEGELMAGYGAPAKATVFLNAIGAELTNKALAFVVDETPAKQGLYIPGTDVPIVAPTAILPDVWLILAHNYEDEIRAKIGSHPHVLVPFAQVWS